MLKVSVIIPVFNAVSHIEQTINSVLEQSYPNIEIVAIDDGSTDGSWDYLNALNLPNFIVKKNKGKGACSARNYGFQLSSGDYIQYLDADDILSVNKIEQQVNAINHQFDTIAVCSTKHFYETIENGKVTDVPFLYSTKDTELFLLNLYGANGNHNMVQTSAWLTPQILIKKAGSWDEGLSKDQDGEFFCRVVTTANQIVYTPNTLNYYRKHINGTNIAGKKQRKHIESQINALESKTKRFVKYNGSHEYKRAFALQYKIIAIDAFPQFKDLSNRSSNLSQSFGGSNFLPVLGGRVVELVKTIFGWKTAKRFSYFVHKYVLK